jgi:hypothetical protein
VYTSDHPSSLEPAAKVLGAASIPFAVRGGGRKGIFGLWVSVEHLSAAHAALMELPGPPNATEVGAFDSEKGGYSRCPACDAELRGGEQDCPNCGLAVGPIQSVLCEECGTVRDADVDLCPSCGC